MPDTTKYPHTEENPFYMPAEWEKHRATWLAWPNDKDFFGERYANIEKVYIQIISALHTDELIKLIVLNQEEEDRVIGFLKSAGIDTDKIIFYQVEYVDVWIRDYGPTFVRNEKEIGWIKWIYNGYNHKFPELLPDDKVFFTLKDIIGFKMDNALIPIEGGAIETNGVGTLLTTRECLLENRIINKTEGETVSFLKKILGVTQIIWLNKGLVNDHTDGHIDEVARFVSPSRILCAYEEDTEDENFERLSENFKILETSFDQDGNKFGVIKLPMPHMTYDDGTKAPVSYANFYIANTVVLVSLFGDKNDKSALSIIESCFPDKNVVGIDCRDLIYGGGALHCITQQEPAL